MENVAGASDSPKLPLPDGCIARILKGVIRLSDAPRQWHLRLNRHVASTRGATQPTGSCLLVPMEGGSAGSTSWSHRKSLGEELGFGSL